VLFKGQVVIIAPAAGLWVLRSGVRLGRLWEATGDGYSLAYNAGAGTLDTWSSSKVPPDRYGLAALGAQHPSSTEGVRE
jgi:succinate dehydrogenase/fumarate reductase flavoprotein subunit